MDKKQLHHAWTIIRRIKVLYIVVLLLVSATITVFALRQNNLGMVERRTAVYQADETRGDVEAALQKLRAYVHTHMNTNLASGDNAVYPPIQLKYTYQRLKEAEQQRTKDAGAQTYTAAQEHCEQLYPGSFSGGPRVPCIEQYITEHKVTEQIIPDALYKFNFASPTWSPDLAGISLLCSLLLAAALAVRIGLGAALKKLSH
jgi:hypothetical protein